MRTNNYLVLLLSVLFLTACEGEKIDFSAFKRSIKVSAHIAGAKTRAIDDTWSEGDAIGIYMITAGQTLSAESVLEKNAKYITEGNGVFNPATVANDVKFPLDGSVVDFISYYPHGTISSTFEYSIDVTDQSNQATIDLMYSNNAKGLNNGQSVNLGFSHQLSKVIINLQTTEGVLADDVSVTLKGMNTKGKFSLIDGTLTSSSSKANIKMKVSGDKKFAEAIVIPTATLTNITLEIINGDYGYVYELSSSDIVSEFESGYKYTYTITLDTRAPLSATATISNWTSAPQVEATVAKNFKVYQPVGAGTEENPYTVEDAQNISPVNGVWVKGFIVGGFTGTSYSSFINDMSDTTIVRNTALALGALQTESSPDKIFPVQLPSGEIRDALNLKSNPENLGKEVLVKGNIGTYLGAPGMPSTSAYQFVSP